MRTRSTDMEFHYAEDFGAAALPEAYERLLLDAIVGDATLFARRDEIEWAWRLVDPVPEETGGELARNIDETAQSMNQTRAEIIRRAVELYLADVEEQWSTLDRLSVPTGLTFDWEEVEALLTKD